MVDTSTVFVVGAGASVGYGFPLGPDLVHELIQRVGTDGDRRTQLINAGFRAGDLDDFAHKLKESDSQSIDTFLEGNQPEYVRIGKAAIALTILEREGLCKHHKLMLSRPQNNPFPNAADHAANHWLSHVWNLMRSGATAQTSGHNKVSFLVFNYDRTIEYYFDTVLAAAFNLPEREATGLRKALRIVHLHGAIPESQAFGAFRPQIPGDTILRLANGILVIHDVGATSDPEVFTRTNATFADARLELQKAAVICFLGFGYHQLNIERLEISKLSANTALYGSGYGLGAARRTVAHSIMGQAVRWGEPQAKSEQFLSESVPLQ